MIGEWRTQSWAGQFKPTKTLLCISARNAVDIVFWGGDAGFYLTFEPLNIVNKIKVKMMEIFLEDADVDL